MTTLFRTLLLMLLSFALLAVPAQSQSFGSLLKKAKDALGVEGDLSPEEISGGLKEALQLGVGEAVDRLSAENGYLESPYKILLPEEARRATDKLRLVPGFANVEQELTRRINHAAERAAKEAAPIFTEAISGMTIRDASDILTGDVDAATRYLHRSTYDQLFTAFEPIVIEALDEVNARTYWREASTAYNKLPFVQEVDTELDDYVTNRALEGLFELIEQKEADIRSKVEARTSPLLQKVFARQDG